MTTWHDQDDWWEGAAEIIFHAQSRERAPQQVEQVLALAAFEPPVRVLDLPCGIGRHTLEFARLGCRVTAVDRTQAYLDVAARKANELGLNVEFVRADMRLFERPDSYDLAVNLYTSFGYFEDPQEDQQVLDNFYTSLRPGGVLVMDMSSKEVLARIFQARDWRELDDGTLILEDRRISDDWTRCSNRWIVIRDGERREFPFSHRLYGASDLRRVLENAGFDPVRIYGDLTGSEYDHNAQRLVAVARKPE
jgi:SAM-dependent methyltransferase